jgi:predicted dehydrogenase
MKIAIVGCGQFADAHIQEARRIPGTTVEAVCDLNPHMVEQAATRHQVAGQFTDLDRMLDEVRPDVVHVTTPPGSHLAIGRAATARGVHVYMEKPFTSTVAEAEELVDLATKAGVQVCVGHSYAFDSAFLRLQAAHAAGSLGDASHIDAVMGYNLAGPFGAAMMGDPTHWVHKLPGGIPHNNISHPVSLVLPFFPDESPTVVARGLRLRPERFGDVRDAFFDELRVTVLGARVTANIRFSCAARPVQMYCCVSGTRAQATASIDGRSLHLTTGASLPGPFAKVQWAYQAHRETRREFWRHAKSLAFARLHFFEGLHALMEQFYLAIAGQAPMPIPMSEAVRATRLIDAIFAECARAEEAHV